MSVRQIVTEAETHAPRHAVITGGEPSLQAELSLLVEALHQSGFRVQIETNGTHPLPAADWVTCSPKGLDGIVIRQPDELKVVFTGQDLSPYEQMFHPQVWSLQPCDTGDSVANQRLVQAALQYVLGHPLWHLSLQTHKYIHIR